MSENWCKVYESIKQACHFAATGSVSKCNLTYPFFNYRDDDDDIGYCPIPGILDTLRRICGEEGVIVVIPDC